LQRYAYFELQQELALGAFAAPRRSPFGHGH
jgi:hypothetical protein